MIGGIFGTIGKTLGIGKEKYFLELDDAAEQGVENLQKAATKATKVAKSTAEEVVDKAQSVVETVTEDATDKAQSVADKGKAKAKAAAGEAKDAAANVKQAGENAVEQAEEKAAEAGKAAKNAAQKSKKAVVKQTADKKAANTKTTAQKGEEKAAKPAVAPPAPSVEDLIANAIAATSKPTNSSGKAIGAPENFSTDYLMPLGNRGRRRPGPSLNPFKGMAKETNPRLKN